MIPVNHRSQVRQRWFAGIAQIAVLVTSVKTAAQPVQSALPGFCLLSRGTAIASSNAGAAAKHRIAQIEAAMAHTSEQQKALIAMEGDELSRRREQMPPRDFQSRVDQLKSRSYAFEQMQNTSTRRLVELRASTQHRIDIALDPIIDNLRSERHCVVIMERNNAYVYANNLDLTADATARLNAALPPFTIAVSQ